VVVHIRKRKRKVAALASRGNGEAIGSKKMAAAVQTRLRARRMTRRDVCIGKDRSILSFRGKRRQQPRF
jgi:hypothetical protein